MKVAHADLAKVARVVLVEIRAVVVLATGHASSAGMLAVLSDTTVAGGDIAATVWRLLAFGRLQGFWVWEVSKASSRSLRGEYWRLLTVAASLISE